MRIACTLTVIAVATVLAAPARADQAPPSPPPPDTTAPGLSAVSMAPTTVKQGAAARVSFTLSEDANVSGAVSEHRSGYLVGGHCRLDAAGRAPGKRRRARQACTRLVRIGSFFAATALKGANVAKLGLSALKPGRYRIVLTPRDATGNMGAAAHREFRIVKA